MTAQSASSRLRIFIDCSFVNFSRQPTGIPRVVLKYIEVGYAWGKRHGVEVVPVLPTATGFTLCRPLPGHGAPQDLVDRAEQSETLAAQSKLASAWKCILSYGKDVVHHSLLLAAAILPVPPMKATATWINDAMERGYTGYKQRIADKNLSVIRYAALPGDVLFAPAYWHDVDPAIYASLRVRNVVVVILVHDLLPIIFENFYPSPWRYLFRDNVRKAFGYASALFTVSNFTKATLSEFGQREKLPSIPMMTAYNGFEPLVSDTTTEHIKQGITKPVMGNGRYYAVAEAAPLLMVGSVEPKKGHIPVIKCLEAMWGAGYERTLVIIGRTGWMERDVVAAIEGSTYFNRKLFWFTDIDDFDLAFGYQHCHALIFSSLAEGFGIPMIEASYYGKPTVAYDTPIVREVLGSSGLLYKSASDFVQHLIELEVDAAHETACSRARELRWPSWDEYTPQVFDVLAQLNNPKNAYIPPIVKWPEPVVRFPAAT